MLPGRDEARSALGPVGSTDDHVTARDICERDEEHVKPQRRDAERRPQSTPDRPRAQGRLGIRRRGLGGGRCDRLAAPAAIAIASAFLAVAFVASHLADSAGDIANDPPRDDYELETVVREPDQTWPAGDSALEQSASQLVSAALRTVAFEAAMVTADERALGAELAGDFVAAAARREEARRFGVRAATLNQELRGSTDGLADAMEQSVPRWEPALHVADLLRGAGLASEDFGTQYLRDHGELIA